MSNESEKPTHISYRAPGQERKTPTKSDPPTGKRMRIDFAVSLAACGIVGALADRAFATAPWCFLVMIFFGFAIGVINARRTMQRIRKNVD